MWEKDFTVQSVKLKYHCQYIALLSPPLKEKMQPGSGLERGPPDYFPVFQGGVGWSSDSSCPESIEQQVAPSGDQSDPINL